MGFFKKNILDRRSQTMDHQPLNRRKLNRHPREGEDCAGAEGGRLGAARGGHTLSHPPSQTPPLRAPMVSNHPPGASIHQWIRAEQRSGWMGGWLPTAIPAAITCDGRGTKRPKRRRREPSPPPPCAPHRPVPSRYVCSIPGQPTPPSIRGRERLGREGGAAPCWPAPPVPSLAACHGEDRGVPQPRHVRKAIGASRPGAGDRGGAPSPVSFLYDLKTLNPDMKFKHRTEPWPCFCWCGCVCDRGSGVVGGEWGPVGDGGGVGRGRHVSPPTRRIRCKIVLGR